MERGRLSRGVGVEFLGRRMLEGFCDGRQTKRAELEWWKDIGRDHSVVTTLTFLMNSNTAFKLGRLPILQQLTKVA